MKKCKVSIRLGVIIGILCFSCMSIIAASSQNESIYLERYQSILQTMKNAMENAPKTGEPALDYLYQMIPHHEAAIAMAENVLQYGRNQKVKQMAQKTIKEQTNEIAKMRGIIKKIKVNPQIDQIKEAAYISEFMQIHTDMMNTMKNIKSTGNVDKDFLQDMMPHHDGAINMSNSILKYTSNPEVKQMAQNIIKKQTAENKEMSKIMSQIK